MSFKQRILIVDDDFEDVFAVRHAFEKLGKDIEVMHLPDWAVAVDFLLSADNKRDLPTIVLLDINMPKVNGFETLTAMRASDLTNALPVIMFSTSDAAPDVKKSYSLGANAYLVKPSSIKTLQTFVQAINDFWLKTVALPYAV